MVGIDFIFILLCIILNVTVPKQDKRVFILNVLKWRKLEEFLNTNNTCK